MAMGYSFWRTHPPSRSARRGPRGNTSRRRRTASSKVNIPTPLCSYPIHAHSSLCRLFLQCHSISEEARANRARRQGELRARLRVWRIYPAERRVLLCQHAKKAPAGLDCRCQARARRGTLVFSSWCWWASVLAGDSPRSTEDSRSSLYLGELAKNGAAIAENASSISPAPRKKRKSKATTVTGSAPAPSHPGEPMPNGGTIGDNASSISTAPRKKRKLKATTVAASASVRETFLSRAAYRSTVPRIADAYNGY